MEPINLETPYAARRSIALVQKHLEALDRFLQRFDLGSLLPPGDWSMASSREGIEEGSWPQPHDEHALLQRLSQGAEGGTTSPPPPHAEDVLHRLQAQTSGRMSAEAPVWDHCCVRGTYAVGDHSVECGGNPWEQNQTNWNYGEGEGYWDKDPQDRDWSCGEGEGYWDKDPHHRDWSRGEGEGYWDKDPHHRDWSRGEGEGYWDKDPHQRDWSCGEGEGYWDKDPQDRDWSCGEGQNPSCQSTQGGEPQSEAAWLGEGAKVQSDESQGNKETADPESQDEGLRSEDSSGEVKTPVTPGQETQARRVEEGVRDVGGVSQNASSSSGIQLNGSRVGGPPAQRILPEGVDGLRLKQPPAKAPPGPVPEEVWEEKEIVPVPIQRMPPTRRVALAMPSVAVPKPPESPAEPAETREVPQSPSEPLQPSEPSPPSQTAERARKAPPRSKPPPEGLAGPPESPPPVKVLTRKAPPSQQPLKVKAPPAVATTPSPSYKPPPVLKAQPELKAPPEPKAPPAPLIHKAPPIIRQVQSSIEKDFEFPVQQDSNDGGGLSTPPGLSFPPPKAKESSQESQECEEKTVGSSVKTKRAAAEDICVHKKAPVPHVPKSQPTETVEPMEVVDV